METTCSFNIISKEQKQSVQFERKGLNFGFLNNMASVKKISANKYKIRMLNIPENIKKITSMIQSFNDIEITYSEGMETSDLIKKSKKPLWKLTQAEDGTFILEKDTGN